MPACVKIAAAEDLPDQWDQLVRNYFQAKKFLNYTEKYNPCSQRYYLLYDSGKLLAGACVYSLKIDLFTFMAVKSPVTMHVVGIPASISCAGLIGEMSYWNALTEEIFMNEKGLINVLNLPPSLKISGGVTMKTLPTVEIVHNFNSWEEYYTNLRSDYRRRYKRIHDAFRDAECRTDGCNTFTDEHFDLYLQIMKKTTTRLEQLTKHFFTNLPPEFRLTSLYEKGKLVTWHINLEDDHRMVFFYGGTNYLVNGKLRVYYNNLYQILREGVNKGYKMIELGQTAEIPKMRMGGNLIEKNMLLFHQNALIRKFLRLFKPLIEYNRHVPEVHVFRHI